MIARLRWLFFAAYLFLLCTLPFTLLWESVGLIIGSTLTLGLLVALRWNGATRLGKRLHMRLLSPAEAPHVHAMVAELSRRIRMTPPRLGLIDSDSLNIAVFGFHSGTSYLALTRGILTGINREELAALIGRQLCHLRSGVVPGETWLSQFLALFESFATAPEPDASGARHWVSFPLFLRQLLFYPLALYPAWVLSGHRDDVALDRRSLRYTRNPRALAEGLRRLEAFADRLPLTPQLNTRHLFLHSPPAPDALGRVFFSDDSFAKRIDAVEELTQVVARA